MPDPALVSTMTADNSPSPFYATALNYYPGRNPFMAFDNDAATYWQGITPPNDWIRIDLGTAARLTSYSVLGSGLGVDNPKDWTMEGSSTGTFTGEETICDTQTGQDTNTEKTYTISSPPGSFRYYRMKITAIDASTSTMLTSLKLYGLYGGATSSYSTFLVL